MQAVHGYFDGSAVKPLEKLNAKPNQRVIITIMDEFIEPGKKSAAPGMRGILSQYADPVLAAKEEEAWMRAATEKHDIF